MRFPDVTRRITGTAIPIGALKTAQSCGIGEFADLIPFARFCRDSGLEIIQLLPVNDTGTESSPYSALSAFALHPVYVRLGDLPEAKGFESDVQDLRDRFENLRRYDYRGLRDAKIDILWKVWKSAKSTVMDSAELTEWIAGNPWIVEYAVFMNIKRKNFDASWKSWDRFRTPSHGEIRKRWESAGSRDEHLFFAWVQMRLDGQFKEAADYCDKIGIALKGDIPIMMNEDSCDAWANPEFFRDDLRAGSPPDDSNPLGQNWGFPIYNWDNLEDDGYGWWKRRLIHASRFYHAYRIDHILGFFRIWSVPNGEYSGYLGWTTPHEPITALELAERGFTGDRLRWICEPHVPTRVVEAVHNNDYLGTHGLLNQVMNRIGDEELWLFKDEIACERDIWETGLPDPVKRVLVDAWRDRLLQVTGRDGKGKVLYAPVWTWYRSTAWGTLSEDEKNALNSLFSEKARKNEELWKGQAERLLGALTGSTDMLACAEDLGSIPDSVPGVLASLGIYSLKVIRWERLWNQEGQPFRTLESYPHKSVATTSVHDSSTLRGWWERERGAEAFYSLRYPETDGVSREKAEAWKTAYGEDTAAWVFKTLACSASRLLVIPLQDLLALSDAYRSEDPDEDRVNVPGSVTAFNWTWRIPVAVETLEKDTKLIDTLRNVFQARREGSN